MLKSQDKSVQRLTRESGGRCKRGHLQFGLAPRGGAGAALLRIADQGMTQMGQVYADLVGAPGFQPAFD